MAVSDIMSAEEMMSVRRAGVVEALTDCLAFLQQDEHSSAAMQEALRHWSAETANDSAAAADPEAAMLRAGRLEGYRLCGEGIAQGLDGNALAALLLQQVFAIWPRAAADYRRGYDAYLEKELQNPRAAYYCSSRVWTTAVDDLRTKVVCAGVQEQAPSPKLLRRAVKLLHAHPERLARAASAAACSGPADLTSANSPAQRPAGLLGAGHGRTAG